MTPQPTPTEGVIDPIRVVVGGDYPPINYGWRADVGLNYYCFGVNHGTTSCTQHTGVDVPVPDETALYSPAAGVVDCVGVNGTPRWDQGCGAYTDTGLGGPNSPIQGVGNITILLDSGHKLTLGHCSSSLVQPGDRVVAGQQVGRSGGQNGYHVHVEVSVLKDGTYWLMDPVAALREAMNGEVPTIICDRLPVPQPQEWDVFVPVKATRDGVPVLQRANAAGSCPVRRPLDKGEEFEGVMLVLGNDMKWYWVSRLGSRIPIDGTAAPNGPQIATA